MEKIRRQFGATFANTLAQCPTLVADLADIRANDVKIRQIGGHCQAYSRADRKTIYIGSKCSMSYQLVALAHEKIHVLVNVTPSPIPKGMGRQTFIDLNLDAETDCICHEVKVVGELLAIKVKVDAHSLGWHKLFQQGGRAAVRDKIVNSFTSNTGESYPEYYGLWYDESVKAPNRLPFHRLFGGESQASLLDLPETQAALPRVPCPRFLPCCTSVKLSPLVQQ